MSSRSPARWMAPLVLLVAIAAVGYVVSSNTGEDEQGGTSSRPQDTDGPTASTGGTTSTAGGETTAASEPTTYTVKPGDTLGTISERTGVSVAELQELNPDLDPQTLAVGDRVRLRR